MAEMKKKDMVKYWLGTAEQDYKTVEHLFHTGDYHWGLFIGHLVVEKMFKALYVQKYDDNPPRLHDLVRLAENCDLKPDDEMLGKLEMISRFNISVRYPDYQREFYKICTKSFSLEALETIKEVKAWLQSVIQA